MIDVKNEIRSRATANPHAVCRELGMRYDESNKRFFCFNCQSDGNQHKDGDFSTVNGWTCHKCGWKGDAFALVKDVKGIEFPAAVDFLGELYGVPKANGNHESRKVQSPGITLKEFAKAKMLPVEFLKAEGVDQFKFKDGKPYVRFPYRNPAGQECAGRLRINLAGDEKFRWKKGSKPTLYGLRRMDKACTAGYAVIVEGESDALTCWFHEIPAVGLPGAGNWKESRDADHFKNILKIFVCIEPDTGGEAVKKWLATSAIRARAHLIQFGKEGDVSGLYLSDPKNFTRNFQAAMDAAEPFTPPTLEFKTTDNLKGKVFAEPNWVIPGIISEGLTLFAGKPKLGKSWFCLAQCVATSCGGKALDSIEVDKGGALYLALEDPERRMQSRLNWLMAPEEPWPSGLAYETVEDTARWQMDNGGIERMEEAINQLGLRILIVDTFKKIRPRKFGGGPDYDRDYEDLIPLQELAHRTGCAIVVVHHTRKMQAEDIIDEISGSSGMSGAADTILVLTRARSEADGILHVTGRDVEEAQLALRKDDHQRWILLGDAKNVERTRIRSEILETIEAHGSMSPKQVAEFTDKNRSTIRTLMAKMADAGDLLSAQGVYSIPSVDR